MNLKPFKLERYFAQYEFSVKYLLSSSDCDGLKQNELLALADSEVKQLWDNLTLGYTESLGHPLLREEIAKLYKGITPENSLVVVPEEGIYIALQSILESSDHVICSFPGYQSLYEISEGLGCEVTRWLPEEDNGWKFNPDFLEKNIKPNTKLIIINFPHNPTGSMPSIQDFQQIMNIAKEKNIFVLSDEMYRFLEYKEGDRLPSACELYDNAVSLFGMSKTFGMAGARIGWVVTKNEELYKKMATFKDHTTICSSAPSEILSIIALRAKDKIIADNLNLIESNLGLLDTFFSDYAHLFKWNRPIAGTIGFAKLLKNSSALEFCQKVVTEANIMLLPSTVYDYGDSHFRLGFGQKNMPEALTKLREYLSGR
ncbi:MAG: aspartate aminotransferase [Candidatus Pacebacteria bacterium CG_4_10_14_0_8_um_filter_42_14]|nr:MAG: aspartate aminotransferase [Candidatus Pacebacteria bacterium CG_4_10_14_0_8_um_filter_42_14]